MVHDPAQDQALSKVRRQLLPFLFCRLRTL